MQPKRITQFAPPFPHQINVSYEPGTNIFLRRFTRIYRHLLSKCFENLVLGRLEMVRCKNVFSDINQKHVSWKICKVVRCFVLLGKYIFYNVKWVKVRKISKRFFEWNYIVKWVSFFASFCCLWHFLLENLKLKDKLQIEAFNYCLSGPDFVFSGLFWGVLASVILEFFRRWSTIVTDILAQFRTKYWWP